MIWYTFDNRKSTAQIYKIDETMEEYPIISITDGDSWVELRREGCQLFGMYVSVFSQRKSCKLMAYYILIPIFPLCLKGLN